MDTKFTVLIGVVAFVGHAVAAGAAQAYVYSADPLQARSSTEDRIHLTHFFYPDPNLYADDPWVVRKYYPQSYRYHHRHHDHHRSHRGGVTGTNSLPAAK